MEIATKKQSNMMEWTIFSGRRAIIRQHFSASNVVDQFSLGSGKNHIERAVVTSAPNNTKPGVCVTWANHNTELTQSLH